MLFNIKIRTRCCKVNLVNCACEPSLFNAHTMTLIGHIFMNVNKLLKPNQTKLNKQKGVLIYIFPLTFEERGEQNRLSRVGW